MSIDGHVAMLRLLDRAVHNSDILQDVFGDKTDEGLQQFLTFLDSQIKSIEELKTVLVFVRQSVEEAYKGEILKNLEIKKVNP